MFGSKCGIHFEINRYTQPYQRWRLKKVSQTVLDFGSTSAYLSRCLILLG